MSEEPKSLSNLLLAMKTAYTERETVTFGDIIHDFEDRGYGFFLFLFALPAALPLPAVGYGTVLGIPLILISVQMLFGKRHVWFPAKIRNITIETKSLNDVVEKANPWVRKLEYLVRPRLGFITRGAGRNLIGLAALIMSVSVLIPLPFTNTVPSLGIALMAVGRIMHDGLAMFAGIVIGLLWVAALVGFTIFFGAEGIELFKELIKSFL